MNSFYSAFFNIHRSGVLTALAWLVPLETAAVSALFVYTIQPCTVSLQGTVSHSNATKVALKALAVWMLGVLHNVQHQTITLFMGTFQRRIHDYFLIHFIMIRLAHDTFAIIMNYQKKKKKRQRTLYTQISGESLCTSALTLPRVMTTHALLQTVATRFVTPVTIVTR